MTYIVTNFPLLEGHVEALVNGPGDTSEVPRVDLDRLAEERRNAGELGDDEGTLGLGLADDVLHPVATRKIESVGGSGGKGKGSARGGVHTVTTTRNERDVSDRKERKVLVALDRLMVVVNGLPLETSVRRVDVVDELRDLGREFGRVTGRGGGNLHEDDLVGPLGVVVEEALEGTEL